MHFRFHLSLFLWSKFSEENVNLMLQLGDEYSVKSLLSRCEHFLENKVVHCFLTASELYDLLEIAQHYSFPALTQHLIKALGRLELCKIRSGYKRQKISDKLLLAILDYKLEVDSRAELLGHGHRFGFKGDGWEQVEACAKCEVDAYTSQCNSCKRYFCLNCRGGECAHTGRLLRI